MLRILLFVCLVTLVFGEDWQPVVDTIGEEIAQAAIIDLDGSILGTTQGFSVSKLIE